MGRRPYWTSHMDMSYCTFWFGRIIQHDLPKSLPCDSPWDNLLFVHNLSPCGKGYSHLRKLLGGLNYEKNRGTISHLHMRWQDVCHNWFPPDLPTDFLGPTLNRCFSKLSCHKLYKEFALMSHKFEYRTPHQRFCKILALNYAPGAYLNTQCSRSISKYVPGTCLHAQCSRSM